MKCPYCNKVIENDATFCGYCGKAIKGSSNYQQLTGYVQEKLEGGVSEAQIRRALTLAEYSAPDIDNAVKSVKLIAKPKEEPFAPSKEPQRATKPTPKKGIIAEGAKTVEVRTKETTETIKKTIKIFFILIGVLLTLTSIGLNIWMLRNNDWQLENRVYYQGKPYKVTQSFFDEKLSQSRQEGHDVGYSEGYTAGEKAGYDKGYSTGRSEGYKQGLNAGAQECQSYISTNQNAICASSQEGLGSSLLPILLQAFLSAIF